MTIWIIALRDNLISKFALALIARIVLSVYLDDRNLVALDVNIFEEMMAFSAEYDVLISSELNEEKCQMYATEVVADKKNEHIFVKAERTQRPWSLGFALPAKSGGDAVSKTHDRCKQTNATALKAQALPHDIRERVLRTVHPTQYSYGREYVKISQKRNQFSSEQT